MTRRGNIRNQKRDGSLTFVEKAEDLMSYTLNITNNPKKFSKRVRFTLTQRIQDLVIEIYDKVQHANELNPNFFGGSRSVANNRGYYQRQALIDIKKLDFFIRFSHQRNHIDDRELKHWSKLLNELRKIVAGWYNNDKKRFKYFQ